MAAIRIQIIQQIFLLGILVSLSVPTAVKIHHIFEDEDHIICTAEREFHFHEAHHDCDFNINLNQLFWFDIYVVIEMFSTNYSVKSIHNYTIDAAPTLNSYLRGPPA